MAIYKCKMCGGTIEFNCHTTDEFSKQIESIKDSNTYAKILRFGNSEHIDLVEEAETLIQE